MKKLFLSQLKPVLRLCYKNKGVFLLSCLLDTVFLAVLLAIQYVFIIGVTDYVTELMDIMQESMAGLAQENLTAISPDLLKTPELMNVYHIIIKYVVIFILAAFLAWIIFKGLNWFIANRLVKQVKPKQFILRFIRHSILAFISLFVIFVILMRMVSYSTSSFLPLFDSTSARFFALALVWLLAYFVALSYSTDLPCRQLIKTGIRHYKELVPAHLLIFLGFVLLSYLTVWVIRFNYWAPVIFALLITIPFVTYGRIYILVVINKALKRGR